MPAPFQSARSRRLPPISRVQIGATEPSFGSRTNATTIRQAADDLRRTLEFGISGTDPLVPHVQEAIAQSPLVDRGTVSSPDDYLRRWHAAVYLVGELTRPLLRDGRPEITRHIFQASRMAFAAEVVARIVTPNCSTTSQLTSRAWLASWLASIAETRQFLVATPSPDGAAVVTVRQLVVFLEEIGLYKILRLPNARLQETGPWNIAAAAVSISKSADSPSAGTNARSSGWRPSTRTTGDNLGQLLGNFPSVEIPPGLSGILAERLHAQRGDSDAFTTALTGHSRFG